MSITHQALALAGLLLTAGIAAADEPKRAAGFEDGLEVYDKAIATREPHDPGFAEALAIWAPLAEAGDAGALYHVGLFHYLGVGGLAIDQPVGIGKIRASAEAGYPTAQAFLGLLAEHGDGVAAVRSDEQAFDWYHKAAQENQCAAVKRLAKAYENGELGVEKSEAAAAEWRGRIEGCRRR